MIWYILGYFISFAIILGLWLYIRRNDLDSTGRFLFSFMSACISVLWPITLPLVIIAVFVNYLSIHYTSRNKNDW